MLLFFVKHSECEQREKLTLSVSAGKHWWCENMQSEMAPATFHCAYIIYIPLCTINNVLQRQIIPEQCIPLKAALEELGAVQSIHSDYSKTMKWILILNNSLISYHSLCTREISLVCLFFNMMYWCIPVWICVLIFVCLCCKLNMNICMLAFMHMAMCACAWVQIQYVHTCIHICMTNIWNVQIVHTSSFGIVEKLSLISYGFSLHL